MTSDTRRLLVQRLCHGDLLWFVCVLRDRLLPARPRLRPAVLAATTGRIGLEIGGPSGVFRSRGMLPVYAGAARLDNVNFSAETRWEHALRDGGEFHYHARRPPGTQWLREAAALTGLADGAYDFVLSSHCLEHTANPLPALREWCRVVRPGGHLLLILPDPRRTFDHRRPVTTLAHLRADEARGTGEDDQTHVAECLALCDLALDPGAGSAENFRERTRHNAANRCLHQHVFDLALMTAMLQETGWRVAHTEVTRPNHLLAWAQKEGG